MIALDLPIGAVAVGLVSSCPTLILTGSYAFGQIAWLYLVTEELVVDAHEQVDTPLISAMFLVGFTLHFFA